MQVKFRGKRKEGDEWLIGDLNHIDGEVFIFPRQEDAPFNSPDWFEVEPSSIGMFTGLTDSNGKEIYGAVGEKGGDIVEDILGGRTTVEWNDDTCKFQFSNGLDINDGDTYGTTKFVVGNIFDNPELLEN